jgi:hypothetical protein
VRAGRLYGEGGEERKGSGVGGEMLPEGRVAGRTVGGAGASMFEFAVAMEVAYPCSVPLCRLETRRCIALRPRVALAQYLIWLDLNSATTAPITKKPRIR